MRGSHHVIIETAHLKYEFDIKRNVTIIQGDSGTGKTTLIDLLQDRQITGDDSTIRLQSDVPCKVFNDTGAFEWQQAIELITDSIVFIDEGNRFIRSKEFAEHVRGSSNYYVLITRDSLPHLPYSIHEIYGIRTSGKFHFPEQVYHEFYHIYDDSAAISYGDCQNVRVITEDSGSGNQFFKAACTVPSHCIAAHGNAKVYQTMREQPLDYALAIVVDGAAFGAFIERVLDYAKLRKSTVLYLPESFEWLIFKSGVLTNGQVDQILKAPEKYIDSKHYMSWKQYFTELLIQVSKDDVVRRYTKHTLTQFYTTEAIRKRIIGVYPEAFQAYLEKA